MIRPQELLKIAQKVRFLMVDGKNAEAVAELYAIQMDALHEAAMMCLSKGHHEAADLILERTKKRR